jgi:hypothetical protein
MYCVLFELLLENFEIALFAVLYANLYVCMCVHVLADVCSRDTENVLCVI